MINGDGVKQKKSRGKLFFISWLVFLSIFIVSSILFMLRVGEVNNIAPLWVSITMGASLLFFMGTFGLWLIIRLGKKIVIPFTILVVIVIVGYILYNNIHTRQQVAACNLYMPKIEESFNLQYDLKKINDKTNNDTSNATWTQAQYKIVLTDFKNLQITNKKWLDISYSILDIFDDHISLFTSSSFGKSINGLDMDFMKNSVKEVYDARDMGYQLIIEYYQALADNESQGKIQTLYKNMTDKITAVDGATAFQEDNLTRLNTAGYMMYSRCHGLLKITKPAETLQSGLIFW